MPYINIDTEVWIEPEEVLDSIKDDELIEEMIRRGYNAETLTKIRAEDALGLREMTITFERLFELKRANSPDFDKAFSDYCWVVLGKVL
jgi:hypothetical protein